MSEDSEEFDKQIQKKNKENSDFDDEPIDDWSDDDPDTDREDPEDD
jgi:hypothetical protein